MPLELELEMGPPLGPDHPPAVREEFGRQRSRACRGATRAGKVRGRIFVPRERLSMCLWRVSCKQVPTVVCPVLRASVCGVW